MRNPTALTRVLVLILCVIATASAFGGDGTQQQDHYKVLGVRPDASTHEVRAAYKRLAKQYHPDRNPEGNDQFIRIQAAHDVLSDDGKRREYDHERRYGGSHSHTHTRTHQQRGQGYSEYMYQGPDGRWYRFQSRGGPPFGGDPFFDGGGPPFGFHFGSPTRSRGEMPFWMRMLQDPAIVLYGFIILMVLVIGVARMPGAQPEAASGTHGQAGQRPEQQHAGAGSEAQEAAVPQSDLLPYIVRAAAPNVPLVTPDWIVDHSNGQMLIAVGDDPDFFAETAGELASAAQVFLTALDALHSAAERDRVSCGVVYTGALNHDATGDAGAFQRALARRFRRIPALALTDADVMASSPFFVLVRIKLATGTARAMRILLPDDSFNSQSFCFRACSVLLDQIASGNIVLTDVTDLLQPMLPQTVENRPRRVDGVSSFLPT